MNKQSQEMSTGCGCLLSLMLFGLLGLFVLPSFLTQHHPIKELEVKQYVGAMNRAQQAYFLDNTTFTNNIEQLGLGIKTETENYKYSIRTADKSVFNYGIARPDRYTYRTESFGLFSWKVKQPIKSYVGAVFFIPEVHELYLSILCESAVPTTSRPADPILQNGVPTCARGTTDLSR